MVTPNNQHKAPCDTKPDKPLSEHDWQVVYSALNMAHGEFTTLIPFLTPRFRKNAEKCRESLLDAIKRMKDEGGAK